MTEKENQCTGSYPVSGYTRDDGVEVDSYIRTCWKHGKGNILNSNIQDTKESIEKINRKLDEINNQEIITDENLYSLEGYLSATISKICEDCENYLNEKDNKEEAITLKSIEETKALEQTKLNTLDNIEKSMHTVDKIEKIQKKKWDTVNITDTNFNKKLQEYAKNQETNKNILKNLSNLSFAIRHSFPIARSYIGYLKDKSTELMKTTIINHPKKSTNAIDLLFYASNKVKFDKINTPDGRNFWEYAKGNIKVEQMNGNGVSIKENKSINDIKNIKLRQFVKDKVKEQINQNDCRGLVFSKDTKLSKKFAESISIKNHVNNFLNNKKNKSIHFGKSSKNLFSVLGKADIYQTNLLPNGNVEVIMVDVYDFNNDNNLINQLGYSAQKEGIIKPFYSIIFVEVKKETFKK